MEIGLALPQMAADYRPTSTLDWARGIDAGPFSSVSAGERVTFTNPEMVTALAACAAVTERVRIFANLWVLPQHAMAMVAQQIGTLDQISAGRLEVAVGVGGREEDYRALGASFAGRHQALDDKVHELKGLLAGKPAFEGGLPVGPPPVQPDGPRILSGAMGPKAMARAAVWADGVSGFSIAGDPVEIASANALADRCWSEAGRSEAPHKVSGCFVALGVPDPAGTLSAFTARYLGFLGAELADAVAATARTSTQDALMRALDGAAAAGCDEFILVPASAQLGCLEALTEAVGAWLG